MAVIIDRFLITGKGKREDFQQAIRENRNVQVSKLHEKQMMLQKGLIKYILGL